MGWFTDPVRFRQYGTGTLFLLGGSLFLLGIVATRWEESNDLASYLDSLAVNPAQSQAAAVLLHFSAACLAGALFGAASMVRGRGVALAHVALILGVLGATTMPGLLIIDFYDLAIAETMPRAEGVALEERVGSYPGLFVIVLPAFLGMMLGMVLTMFALWRAGFLPLWVPILVVTGYGSEALRGLELPPLYTAVATALVLLVAYAYTGVRILWMAPGEWTRGTVEAGADSPAKPSPSA